MVTRVDFASSLSALGEAIRNTVASVRQVLSQTSSYLDQFYSWRLQCQQDTSPPLSIRGAVHRHCRHNTQSLFYSGYTATFGRDKKPVLTTNALQYCVGIVLYDRRTTTTVMAHLTTVMPHVPISFFSSDPPIPKALQQMYLGATDPKADFLIRGNVPVLNGDLYQLALKNWVFTAENINDCSGLEGEFCQIFELPYSWYVGTFKHDFFGTAESSTISITIFTSTDSNQKAADRLTESAQYFFPMASITRITGRGASIDVSFDSRTGELTERHYNLEGHRFVTNEFDQEKIQ